MTYEEAIKNINALNAVCGQKAFYDAEFESALALAIEALEKQMPKKPKLKKVTSTLTASVCPNCGSIVHHAYCPECGQATDWSDFE